MLSWGAEDLKAFRDWLRRRYQSPEQLNEAWGSAFWSMEVQNFDEVALPNLTVTEPNPAARLDFWRFPSEQVAAYDRMQCEIIRRHSPGRWITHNFMGFFNGFDHWALGERPRFRLLGFLSDRHRRALPVQRPGALALAGHVAPGLRAVPSRPLSRRRPRALLGDGAAAGTGQLGAVEPRAGARHGAPVDARSARARRRGRELFPLAAGAFRAGADARRAQPAGLARAFAGRPRGGGGRRRTSRASATCRRARAAPVAIVYDYEAHWVTAIQPQGEDFRYPELVFRWYEAIRRLGLDVDFVGPGAPLDELSPGARALPADRLGGRRAGLRRGDAESSPSARAPARRPAIFRSPRDCRPGRCGGSWIAGDRSLLDAARREARRSRRDLGPAERWREQVETRAETLATFADGAPALVANGHYFYLGCWPDAGALGSLMALLCRKAGLSTIELPAEVRLRRRGDLAFAFNYGETPWPAPFGGEPLIGAKSVAPRGFAVWRS